MCRLKRLLFLVLSVFVILSIAGCAGSQTGNGVPGSPPGQTETASQSPQQPASASQSVQAGADPSSDSAQDKDVQGVPSYALAVWDQIKQNHFKPLEGYKSQTFGNYEKLLPILPQGERYIEHDVHLYHQGVNRGAERIVYNADGSHAYYTGDHYASFITIE